MTIDPKLAQVKILNAHPAIRTYREPIFRRLGEMGVHFLFTQINEPGTHAGEETQRILERFPYPYHQAREAAWFPYRNLSPDLIRVFRYDVVIFAVLTSIPFLLTAPLLKLLGKKIVLFDEIWRYAREVRTYRLAYPYVRFLVRHCVDAFVVAGSKCQAMYREEFGIPESKLYTAYDTTLDLMQVPRSPKKAAEVAQQVRAFAGSRKVILYLGRLLEIKAVDVLIRAMAQLPEEGCLVIVGAGPTQPDCERLVRELNLEKRVCFLGGCRSDEALYYYLAADISVLPSRFMPSCAVNSDSWGFTLNEAMSLEVPVVATTAVGASYDLIRDGETGMLAQENDPHSLAEKLRYLLCDDERRQRIGRQGRTWLLERCSYDQNFTAYQAALYHALGVK